MKTKFRAVKKHSVVKHTTFNTDGTKTVEELNVSYKTHEAVNHTKAVGSPMGDGCYRVNKKGGAE